MTNTVYVITHRTDWQREHVPGTCQESRCGSSFPQYNVYIEDEEGRTTDGFYVCDEHMARYL